MDLLVENLILFGVIRKLTMIPNVKSCYIMCYDKCNGILSSFMWYVGYQFNTEYSYFNYEEPIKISSSISKLLIYIIRRSKDPDETTNPKHLYYLSFGIPRDSFSIQQYDNIEGDNIEGNNIESDNIEGINIECINIKDDKRPISDMLNELYGKITYTFELNISGSYI